LPVLIDLSSATCKYKQEKNVHIVLCYLCAGVGWRDVSYAGPNFDLKFGAISK